MTGLKVAAPEPVPAAYAPSISRNSPTSCKLTLTFKPFYVCSNPPSSPMNSRLGFASWEDQLIIEKGAKTQVSPPLQDALTWQRQISALVSIADDPHFRNKRKYLADVCLWLI